MTSACATETLVEPPMLVVERAREHGGHTMWRVMKPALVLCDQAVISGMNFAATVIVGRWCGAEELGIYALAFSGLMLMMSVHQSLIGAPYAFFSNHVAGRQRARCAGSALLQHAALTALAVAAAGTVAGLLWLEFPTGPAVAAATAVAAVLPFVLLRELARRMALAEFSVGKTLLIDVATAAMQLAGLAWLAGSGGISGTTTHVAMGTGAAAIGLTWLVLARHRFEICWQRIGHDAARHWSFGKWILAAELMGIVAGLSCPWLLGLFLTVSDVGMFVACSNVVLLANPILLGVGNVLDSQMSRAAARGGRAAVRHLAARVTCWLALLMGVLCLAFSLAGDTILALIYGSLPRDHHPLVIPFLAAAFFIRSPAMVMGHSLRVLQHGDLNVKSTLVGSLVTIAVVVLGTLHFGILAGACALFVGNLVELAIRSVFFRWVVTEDPE